MPNGRPSVGAPARKESSRLILLLSACGSPTDHRSGSGTRVSNICPGTRLGSSANTGCQGAMDLRAGHDDRDFARRLFCRHSGGSEPSDDDIDLETNQLSCQFGKPVDLSFRRPKLKSNVLPLDISQIA